MLAFEGIHAGGHSLVDASDSEFLIAKSRHIPRTNTQPINAVRSVFHFLLSRTDTSDRSCRCTFGDFDRMASTGLCDFKIRMSG